MEPSLYSIAVFFWKMLSLADLEKLSNFNSSKCKIDSALKHNLMSNYHIVDIYDNVYIHQMFFTQHILTPALLLTTNTNIISTYVHFEIICGWENISSRAEKIWKEKIRLSCIHKYKIDTNINMYKITVIITSHFVFAAY